MKRTKKKLKGLEAKIAAAQIKLSNIPDSNDVDESRDDGNAGDAFGGSNEMSNKKRKS